MRQRRRYSARTCCRRLRAAAIALYAPLVLACVPRRALVLAPEYAFTQRDSVEQAFNAGVRDARRFGHLNPSPADVVVLATMPASWMAPRVAHSLWVYPGLWIGTGLGAWLLAQHADRQPLPLPPDSFRQLYDFRSEVMWKRYQFGYQSVMSESRQGTIERSAHLFALGVTSAVVLATLTLR